MASESATSGKVGASVTVIVSLSVTYAGVMVDELIVSVSVIFPEQEFEYVAVTVIGKLPDWVVVPLRNGAEKVTPVGKAPLSEKVVAPTPPVSVKVTGP
jgi:hypothetical protein